MSRANAQWHEVPKPEQALGEFVSATKAAITAGGYDVVLGARDEDVAALCYHRAELGAPVAAPPSERVFRAQDKVELSGLARLAGLATPLVHDDPDFAIANWKEDQGPKVVKPRLGLTLSRTLADGRLPGKAGTRLVANASEARAAIDETRAAGHDPVLQDRCKGDLGALVIVCDQGSELIGCMQQRSLKTWPLDSGVSVRAETVPVEGSLRDRVQALVRELGWIGLAQLQFLYPPGGEPRLIDFNGRIYGSMALALAAGVNFPDALCRTALQLPCAVSPAVTGVQYQWLWGDVRRASQDRHTSGVRDWAGLVAYATRANHSVWSTRDPVPSVVYARAQLHRSLKRRRR